MGSTRSKEAQNTASTRVEQCTVSARSKLAASPPSLVWGPRPEAPSEGPGAGTLLEARFPRFWLY